MLAYLSQGLGVPGNEGRQVGKCVGTGIQRGSVAAEVYLKNIRKWGKLQEAIRPTRGSPCVSTTASFHLSSSSTNLSNLVKLLIVSALTL